MVALRSHAEQSTRRRVKAIDTPLVWRIGIWIDRALVRSVGRIEITGEFPPELRGRPVLVAANHIGMFDPFVLIAACAKAGFPPRFMLTAGLLDAPVLGAFLRKSGHLRVDRGKANVAEAFNRATEALGEARIPLLVYPEGRVSREPGLWPERGKTGVARMALAGDVPVVTISQWGAHEAVYWGSEVVSGWKDVKPLLFSFFRAMRDRPVFRVHFGPRVDLSGLTLDKPGDAMRAHTRIMQAITADLIPLRADEPDTPKFHDPTRPCDSKSPWRP
ncbi:1-acyl-sn-glycerol-3-phosphate acyltransferase [Alloactinosynnema sp. L-07]|uniref:lysophospholipid acyltransferase family protein n=1 Tax=Alloactinosynnema sp. L-07 TaxID=1653480 RepID=UPI0006B681E6|nr:lysophospholipid acyltransferase family protein [Alloactinosynnema sp. L-07]